MNVDSGVLTIPGSTGEQIYSHNCSNPKLLLLFSMRDDDGSNVLTDHQGWLIGAFDVTDGGCVAAKADHDYTGGSAFYTTLSNLYQMYQFEEDGFSSEYWGFESATELNTSDFRLTWSVVGAAYTGNRIFWVVVGGSDVQAKVLYFNTETSTGLKDYTSIGFQGNVFLNNTVDVSLNSSTANTAWATGVAVGNGEEAICYHHGGYLFAEKWYYTDRALFASGSVADFDSWLSNGIRLNYTTASSARGVQAIVLKVPSSTLGTITQPTSTGIQNTGVGNNVPRCTLFLSSGQTATGSTNTIASTALGIAISRDLQFGIWGGMTEDAPSEAGSHADDRRCVVFHEEGGAFSLKSEAKLIHQGSEGLDINWITADAVQRKIVFVAMGEKHVETKGMMGLS